MLAQQHLGATLRMKMKALPSSINNKINSYWCRSEWSWSLSLRLVYPVLHKPPGATITSRSAVRIRINFWRMVGLYISFGDWANALECWRSPSLRLVIPGIAVSPGVTHSDSRIVFVTGTVVKPQQPPYWCVHPLVQLVSVRLGQIKPRFDLILIVFCWSNYKAETVTRKQLQEERWVPRIHHDPLTIHNRTCPIEVTCSTLSLVHILSHE